MSIWEPQRAAQAEAGLRARAGAGLCIGGGMLGLAAAALPGEPAPGVDAQGVVIGLIAALVGLALVFLGRRAPGVVYDVVAIAAVVGTGAQLRLVAGSEQMGTGQVIPGELILVPIVLFVGALRPIRSCVAVGVAIVATLAFAYSALDGTWGSLLLRLGIVAGFLWISGALVVLLRRRVLALVDELEQTARTDPLTGLANRRAFDDALARHLAAAERTGTPVSVIVADVDHFKSFNDRFGHAAGDEVLVGVARLIASSIRPIDVGARLGGEEFAIALPGVSVEDAAAVAKRIAGALQTAIDDRRVTCSFGVAEHGPDGPDGMLRRADGALYRAKEAGRDRVELAPRERRHRRALPPKG